MGLFSVLQGICERGCIFAFAVVGAYITSRVIRFDDLTLEGSFGLGGALAGLLMTHHVPVWLHLPAVIMAGMAAGLATGLLHHCLGINALISGIVVMTGMFSINLKIAGAHMIIPRSATIFHAVGLDAGWHWMTLSVGIISVIYAVRWLLSTEYGLCLRAIGDNPHVITQNGRRARVWHTMGLMLANAITAVGGYLLVSHIGYFSIWAAFGVLIIALAGLMLAELISTHRCSLALLIGAIMYQSVIALTFQLHIDQDWNKFVSALIIVILMTSKHLLQEE